MQLILITKPHKQEEKQKQKNCYVLPVQYIRKSVKL